MSNFLYQAISGGGYTPNLLSVSARTLSAGTSVQLVNLTACAPLLGSTVVGLLYNAPLSTTTQLSSFSSLGSTTFSAFGSVFQVNNAFNNQNIALLLQNGGTVEFTMASSGSTVALTQASAVAYDDSWPDIRRKQLLGYI